MIIVKTLADIQKISDPAARDLVRQRIQDLGGEAFGSNALGYFIVGEAGDAPEAISAQLGFNILCNRVTGIRYDQPNFVPSFEFIEEMPCCYDMVFILSDDGFGVELVTPKMEGIDPDLLAMCRMFAFKEDAT